jgi:hypothetical protein
MTEWFRVKDAKTGHEYTSPFLADGLTEVKNGETHDAYGNINPPVYAEAKSSAHSSKEAQK